MKIGVITDCFKKTLDDCIKTAGKLGVDGVQIYATSGEFSPKTLTVARKEEIKRLLKENNLVVSALCGDMGGFGFEKKEENAERVEKTKKIINLAAEFGASTVTTHIGVIPQDKNQPRYNVMLEAITEAGIYAKEWGVTLAIETGPENAKTLLEFLKDTKGGVGVNLDPANFVMVTGQNPVEAVKILKDYIVHTHAKDGVKLSDAQTPAEIYHAFATGGVDALNACESFKEKPLGEGHVNWAEYIFALKETGYDGFLTVERETGGSPEEDIVKAVDFLKKVL